MNQISKIVMDYRKKYAENHARFQSIFGVPLITYWDKLLGFDICSFDLYLKVPDGTSTHDWILEKYGQDAVTLVEYLL